MSRLKRRRCRLWNETDAHGNICSCCYTHLCRASLLAVVVVVVVVVVAVVVAVVVVVVVVVV
jgi:hypothetical protein